MKKTCKNNGYSKASIQAAAAQVGSLPVDLQDLDFPEKQDFAEMADYGKRARQTDEGKELTQKRKKGLISREDYSEGIWAIIERLAEGEDEKTKKA